MPLLPQHINKMPQGVRFLIAGGFAALVNWLVRFPLSLVMPFPLAVGLATAIGMTVGFISYRHLVFPGSDRVLSEQLRDFILVNLASMAIVTGVAVLFADVILPQAGVTRYTEALAHAIGIAVGAVSNFYGHRLVSFRQPDPVRNRHR